jgi:2-polyprenyl-6-methoxyphenol hydroxylase-like FAD-dependent oxidoreductase
MEVNATRGRAIIIGASLAGLFAATLLRKAGWHTEVFERSDVELVGRGAGITTHPELLQSPVRSGADLNDLGVVVHERIALDAGGRVVERLPYEQIVTSWDRRDRQNSWASTEMVQPRSSPSRVNPSVALHHAAEVSRRIFDDGSLWGR